MMTCTTASASVDYGPRLGEDWLSYREREGKPLGQRADVNCEVYSEQIVRQTDRQTDRRMSRQPLS